MRAQLSRPTSWLVWEYWRLADQVVQSASDFHTFLNMAAVKICLFAIVILAYIAESQQQTCNAVNKKCAAVGECCSKCCLGTKCVDADQCAPKCTADLIETFKCKSAAQECFMKTPKTCSKPPCKPEPACRFVPPCNRLSCPKNKHCVDIGGNPPTAACQPDKPVN